MQQNKKTGGEAYSSFVCKTKAKHCMRRFPRAGPDGEESRYFVHQWRVRIPRRFQKPEHARMASLIKNGFRWFLLTRTTRSI